MFNTKLMETSAYSNNQDSFSSGSEVEDEKMSVHFNRRKSRCPRRAIPHEYAMTTDEKAKAGIFVVDPFHCKVNIEFLKAFAQHHLTGPLLLNRQNSYFTSSSEEDEAAAFNLAPDMSHMGFNTGSSASDDENCNLDFWDTPIKPVTGNKKRNNNNTTSGSGTTKKKPKSTLPSGTNSTKIISSSSIPRPSDNSEKFPIILSSEQVMKLADKVYSNYKNYPQNQRHGSTPMDISTCPGVRLLNEDEYISCSLLRIRPALFFHARNTLLHNFFHSVGYFRKSAAQKMLRIDVNKTGKFYDFLVRQNWLPQFEGGPCRPEPEQVIIDDPETYHQL